MTTRAGRLPPPLVSPEDAGPWSVVSPVRHAQAVAAQVRARRLAEPRFGLVTMPPPRVAIDLVGLNPDATVAGAGVVKVIAAARQAAHHLDFADGDTILRAVAPHARRTWVLPDLSMRPEERDGTDPAADLPAPMEAADLDGDLTSLVRSPDERVGAVVVRDGRAAAVAIVNVEPRALVRWIAGARAVAWNADGTRLAIGGPWGVMLLEHLPE